MRQSICSHAINFSVRPERSAQREVEGRALSAGTPFDSGSFAAYAQDERVHGELA